MKVLKEFLGHVQCSIGDWFYCGFVVKKNSEKAIYWFRKAVEKDNANAQYYIGICHSEGDGIYQNYEQAVYWFYKAAERGHAKAQFSLGLCYANGEGVAKDLTQAVYWYRKSAEQGNENAQNNLKFYDNSDSDDSNALNTKSAKNKKKKETFKDRFMGALPGVFGGSFAALGFWIAKGLFNGISFYVFVVPLIISFFITGIVLCDYAVHFKRKLLILLLALISAFGLYAVISNVPFPKKPCVITMTTDSPSVVFSIAGNGLITIDWGDGVIEKIMLPKDQYDSKKFSRSYYDESYRTITVKGNIWRLFGSSNKLINLDVSKNAELIELDCSKNKLTSLGLRKNSALKWLDCSENQLTNLHIRKNTALIELDCHWNNLTSLDVNKNTTLTHLFCYGNLLTSLDVNKNTALIVLSCNYNNLTSLDVSKNIVLTDLYCAGNQLVTLDISKNTMLTSLNCYGNQLTNLDISKNTELTNHLYFGGNQLNSFDINNNSRIVCDEFGNCQMIFSEYFNSNENPNQWQLTNETSYSSKIVSNKGLLMENKNGNFIQTISVPVNTSEDFSIETTVNFIKGTDSTGHGLIWGFKDWDNYCYFLINADGYYKIGYMYNGAGGELKEWEKTPYINKNADKNLIKVNCVNYTMYYSINGEIVFTKDFYTLMGNYMGFLIEGEKEVLFENLIVKRDVSIPRSWSSTTTKQSTISKSGTGFFIDTRGYIATNHHVIEGASEIEIEFNRNGQKQTHKAKVIGSDQTNDLAVIKIDDNSFIPFINLPYNFQTNLSAQGSYVFTLGYPISFILGSAKPIFNDGKISSQTGMRDDPRSYQISVQIHGGNSGGPLFDNNGNLIGITSSGLNKDYMKMYFNQDVEAVNYAIKSLYLKSLIEVLPESLNLPNDRTIANKEREEKVKIIEDYVVLIKVR